MRLLLLYLSSAWCAMMPVEQPIIDDTMTEKELESLLHYAIRHSDPQKLRDLATSQGGPPRISSEEAAAVMEAMYASESLFIKTVNETILLRNWTSEEELLGSLEFIEDYGDHLLDKGDLLHGVGALRSLVDWVVQSTDSSLIHEKVANLLVSVTQNREGTKKLILDMYPDLAQTVFSIIRSKYSCKQDDSVCASLISVITAIVGGNKQLMTDIDESVIGPVAGFLGSLSPSSKTFSRILTLLKVVTITVPSSEWKNFVDIDKVVEYIGSPEVGLSVGERILALMPNNPEAKARIYSQCISIRKSEEACTKFKLDYSSDEL